MGKVVMKKAASSEPTGTVIARILNECQHSQGLHARRVKELVAWRSDHREGFLKEWWTCLLPIFTIFKREPSVERLVKFVAAFAAYRDQEHGDQCDAFLEEFFGVLLYSTDAPSKAVRFRACQILSEVILRLEENAEVSDELWDEVIISMQRRMQDKIPAIRVYAARALARFANADGSGEFEDDAIVSAYRKALQSDQNADVRRTVVLSMPPSNATVVDIVKHTADVSEAVRRSAFTVLAKKFPIQSLSIKQRTSVLQRGLHDRVIAVQTDCIKMLKEAWLAKCCQGDAIELLKYLDVETNESVGESVMLALLKADLIPLQDGQNVRKFLLSNDAETGTDSKRVQLLEAEEALYWRMLISYLHSEAQAKGHDAATTGGAEAAVNAAVAAEKNELLERILPSTMADYVDLVKAHLNAGPNFRFVSRQLLLLGKFLDFSDATNWKVAGALLQDLLQMPAEHGHLDSEEEDKEVLVGDGLSLGGDKDWAKAVAELAWKVYGAPGEFEKVVSEAVADLSRPCREGGADIMQWVNCLAVTGLLLENIKSLHQLPGHAIEAQEMLNGLLLPAAKHIHPEVQRAAHRCLGLFCVREQRPSLQAVKQLRLALSNSTPLVQKMASKALFDLSMWHGAAMLDRVIGIGPDLGPIPIPRPPGVQAQGGTSGIPAAVNAVDGDSAEGGNCLPLLELLAVRLDADETEQEQVEEGEAGGDKETVQTIIAEGFAKLLLQSKVFSDILPMQHTILGKLLRLYFNEETKSVPRLRQCLSVFFDTYPAVDLEHKKCISKAFIPVMRSEWPGIYGNESGSPAISAAKKRHATMISRFFLQLLHQPLFKAQDHSANTCARHDDDGDSIEHENCTTDQAKAALCDEELAIRIAAEVTGFSSKRSAAAKSYLVMLSKTVASLEFRPSEQEAIKCMRKLLEYMKDAVTGDKLAMKELEGVALRLKELDSTPDEGLSDEQLQIILSNMELENLRLGHPCPEEEVITPAPTLKKGGGRRRPKRSTTPDSCSPPVLCTPAPTRTVRSLRASKTAAMGKMLSVTAPSKKIIYASSDEELISSSTSSDEFHDTDSEFEVEVEEQEKGIDDGQESDSAVLTENTISSKARVSKKQTQKQSVISEIGDSSVTCDLEGDENVEGDENREVDVVTSEIQPTKMKSRNVKKEPEGQESAATEDKKQGSEQACVEPQDGDTLSAMSKGNKSAVKRTVAKASTRKLYKGNLNMEDDVTSEIQHPPTKRTSRNAKKRSEEQQSSVIEDKKQVSEQVCIELEDDSDDNTVSATSKVNKSAAKRPAARASTRKGRLNKEGD